MPRCTQVNAKKLRFVTRYTLALEGSINYGVETSSTEMMLLVDNLREFVALRFLGIPWKTCYKTLLKI